ncbi:MAG: aromatic ring-hydroxylating dioxygenase subunit alpha [Oscillatoria sp. PMC 1051.18]|nr:aromatic ring-hydroxylating dioxygenase subunit alpha [Oscillatoria sp. PMC 1050.18]MEC5032240.1 aromatic ring-hydroxylating dioxygenase subunit alpha [Oscillatoria sp. PMC 1051.18]
MLTEKQQEILTQTAADTPMGKLLRCYWMPIAASCDLEVGAVRPTRLLGEDLVLFRKSNGELGLIESRCPHRGTSLAYGYVDGEGIRCPYHGWKFAPSGRCLEMPAEPKSNVLCEQVAVRGYPVQELGGLIFAYLGTQPAPLLPHYDLFVWEGTIRDIGYAVLPCNWLQIMENSVDPYHLEWLHGHHLGYIRQKSGKSVPTHYPKRQVQIGFDVFEYGIIKRRILEGGSEDDDDWKIGHPLIFPLMLRVGCHPQHRFQIRVPVDDTHTLHFWYSCYQPTQEVEIPKQEIIPSYEVPWRDERGEFILDFVDGQDIMSWVTQGAIADRTQEHLTPGDRGIVLYRRLLFEQLEKVQRGEDPLGVIRSPELNQIIELPQEKNKFGQGRSFLAESMEMSHVRYSPLKNLLAQIL